MDLNAVIIMSKGLLNINNLIIITHKEEVFTLKKSKIISKTI